MDSQTMLLAPGILFVILLVATGSANAGCVGVETGTDFGCGDTVTESCTFDENMSCSSGHGLIIGASNITIDGKGYILDGVNSVCTWEDIRCGILNDGYDNVVIKNSEFKNFCNGITLRGNSSNHIENNTIENGNIHHNGNATSEVPTHGIKMQYVFNSTIRNNSIHDTIAHVDPNPGCEDGGNGMFLYKGDFNLITQNKFYNNTKGGLFIKMKPKYWNISHNHLWGNGQGGIILRCCLCNFNLIEHNNASDNYGSGIFIGGNNNTIRYNTVCNNKDGGPYDEDSVGGHGYGIFIGRSDGSCFNELYENTICGNDFKDIYVVDAATGNTGDENTCDTTYNYNDEGTTTGCTYSCGSNPGCVAKDGTVYRCGDTVRYSCTFNGTITCSGTGDYALTIGADNIVIDGAGYELIGNNYNWKTGIQNLNYSSVVIKSLNISEFYEYGIWFSGKPYLPDPAIITHIIKNCVIENCTVHDIGTDDECAQGVYLKGMSDSTIKGNTVYNVIAFNGDDCESGGNGIFFFGGKKAGKPASQRNEITCNWFHDNQKAGFFTKARLSNSNISYNNASGNSWDGIHDKPGGIVCRCKSTNGNNITHNNLSNNYGDGLYMGGCGNTIKYNTIVGNSNCGIDIERPDGSDDNEVSRNAVCSNTAGDIRTCGTAGCENNFGNNNTCDSCINCQNAGNSIYCNYTCNDLKSVYFDFDSDTFYSKDSKDCVCGVGACCNPGLFNESGTYNHCDSGVCSLTAGDDPNDCNPSIQGVEKSDLKVTEQSEEWVTKQDKTYNVTYTVKNIGDAESGASTTSIKIDGTEVATDSVPELAPSASHTATVGPFTMSGENDTILVCADKDDTVSESDEENNCLENMFELPSAPQLVTYTISNRTITPPQTTEIDVEFSERVEAWINIEDSDRNLVNELYHSPDVTDPNPKTWDGTYTNGTQAPDGNYYVNVTGINTTTELSVVNDTETITITSAEEVPVIISFAPESPVSDTEGATKTFNITTDQKVNVRWLINGTEVQTNESVTEASYTNASAAIGTWNVTAVVENANGTDKQTWEWIVTAEVPAPSIISYAPESPVSDTEGATKTFNITTDQKVNVRWLINGTEVQTNGSVTEASYTNASAAIGTWNVTAAVENANGADMQTWIWKVTDAGAVPTADYLEIENTSGGPGTYVDVPVNIKNVKNGPVQGIRLTVDYDESVLNLTKITSNDLTSNWTELQLGEEGHTMIIATDYTGDAIPGGSSGAVVLLNFSVIGSPEDTSPMNLSLIELSNPDGKVGTAPAKNGVFTVSELSTIIAGRITYSCNGTEIAGVVVNLTKGGTVVNTTVTNETGYYIFTSVNPDSYYVNASKPQFFDNSTEVTVTAGETRIEDMMLWLKGDLNNEGIIADVGDVVLMLRASVGDIPSDERYDLNGNGVIADAGDVVLMLRAAIGDIILW